MTRVANRLGRTIRRLTLGAAASAAVAALVVPSALASPESDAADAINQAWQAAGGANSVVGGKDGEVYPVGAGYAQEFSDGKIFFTPTAGAHVIYGPVLDKYESLGGPADSDLGFPNMNVVPGLVNSRSRVSTFDASDKPAIFWTAETGAWSVRGAINAAWDKLGGSAGQLGVPVEDERYDGDVVSQKFSGGQLSWNSKANTFTSDPPGLADSLVGLDVPRDPVTMINLAWRASGGLGGPLGARQGELSLIGDTTAAQGYAGGKVFYSPETGAHAVTGAILSKYESLGGPTGDLGLPAGPEADGGVPNSRISSFSAPDKPAIFWTPDTGAIVVRGPINAAWANLGGATGDLGVPSGEQTAKGDTLSQTFTGGELSWNKATKEFSSKPAGLAAQLSGLELPDAVAQTPAAPSSGGTSDESGWRWWWLAIILPLLALLGLMAMLAQRKSRPQHEDVVADRGFFGNETEDDYWPGRRTESTDTGRDFWSPPAVDSAGLDSDEDAIDTAPTRVPSEADLAEAGYTEPPVDEWVAETPTSGRHSTSALGASPAAWRLELDETSAPRRRHAAEESRTDEFDVVVDEPVERVDYRGEFESEYMSELQPEFQPTYQSGRQGEYQPEFESRYQPSYQTEYQTEHQTEHQTEYQAEYQPDYEQRVDEGAEEPWRPAIHLPLADPYQAPDGYWIKGNTHSGLYYTPDSVLYDNTIPEVWFASEDVAQANGFVRAPE